MPSKRTRAGGAKAEREDAPVGKRLRVPIREAFTVISWNMQGGGSDVDKATILRRLMRRPSVVAICLQECGDLFQWTSADLEPEWEIAKHRIWSPSWVNLRCSLAILAKRQVSATHEVNAESGRHRPVIGVTIAGYKIFTAHLPRNNVRYLEEACQYCNTTAFDSRGWMCVGDFNIDASAAPLSLSSGIKVRPRRQTHVRGREIDYGYLSCRYAVGFSATTMGFYCSDHFPVEFTIALDV
jgi:endonuclease/exonuclease/phosphatase family metal-dependent hydrolase